LSVAAFILPDAETNNPHFARTLHQKMFRFSGTLAEFL
jgi:hypothetical protein